MKRVLNILVAVVTCFCVLTATTLPAFAASASRGVNVQGYEYYLDEEGAQVFDYAIELDPTILTYEMLSEMGLFLEIVPGSGAFDLSYIVQDVVPHLEIVAGSGAALGGAAAGGGGVVAGAAATIAGLSAGQIVLIAALVGGGILLLTEPELVKTTVNDIWTYLNHQTQLALDDMYFQDTWLIDEDITSAINAAVSDVTFISNGVVWSKSLIISTDDMTGLTDTFPTDRIVVENQPIDALTVDFFELTPDMWTSIDTSGTMYYKLTRSPRWSDSTGYPINSTPEQSSMNCYLLTVLNTATGAQVSFYPNTDMFTSSRTGYIAPPVFINDGEKVGMEIVFGIKKSTSSFYTFYGQTIGGTMEAKYPWIMSGTGTELDGMLILDVSYVSSTGMWRYRYKPVGASYNNNTITSDFPLEPLHWVFSPSQRDTNTQNSGAVNTTESKTELDKYGKIETTTTTEVPQLKPMTVEKLETETTTEKDPNTGEETQKETAILPSNKPGTDPGTDPNPDPNPDPENPNTNNFTAWITAVFSLKHLFDWLPERISKMFDNYIAIAGTLIVTMIVWAIGKRIFGK